MEEQLNELLLSMISIGDNINNSQHSANIHQYNQFHSMSIDIKLKIGDFCQIMKDNRKMEADKFKNNFYKILFQISQEIKNLKNKYNELDKEKLVDEKCLKLARSINEYRSQCLQLRRMIKAKKIQLKTIKTNNNAIKVQNDGTQKLIIKKSVEKDFFKSHYQDIKQKTSSSFFRNTVSPQPANSIQKGSKEYFRKTQKTAQSPKIRYFDERKNTNTQHLQANQPQQIETRPKQYKLNLQMANKKMQKKKIKKPNSSLFSKTDFTETETEKDVQKYFMARNYSCKNKQQHSHKGIMAKISRDRQTGKSRNLSSFLHF